MTLLNHTTSFNQTRKGLEQRQPLIINVKLNLLQQQMKTKLHSR